MLRLSSGRWPLGLVIGLALALLPGAMASAQVREKVRDKDKPKGDKPEKVRFESYDHVELHGSFYPSKAGSNAPCVIMLHGIGGNREQEGWDELAEKLRANYSVLTFDFRGHGDSTDVTPGPGGFWADGNNRPLGANSNKKSISWKDFPKTYYPMLVNDIAAARHFLDLQSNSNRCNSSNLIILGEKDGATLGALWVATEWHRRLPVRNAFGVEVAGSGSPEGKDIACCVWLSLSDTLGTRRASINDWFTRRSPDVKEKVPMVFIYGANDERSRNLALVLEKNLKYRNTSKIGKLTGTKAIEKTNLDGKRLLKPSLGVPKYIDTYLEAVMEARGSNPPERRTLRKEPFPVPITQFLQ